MEKTLAALKAYATDFYSNTPFGESNVVGSPLGSWLLLASVAASLKLDGNPELKRRTEESLHLSVEEAGNAVQEILANYPALNYVSHSWSAPNLDGLPAVQKWIEANTLIPHEGSIPSQEQINEWASTNTNELIKEFPTQMTEEVVLIIANIIYSKLSWVTKFHPIPATEAMSGWGVEKVLTANATKNVTLKKNENNDFFAVYDVFASSEHKESVRLVTCLSKNLEPVQLMESLNTIDSLETVQPDDELLLTFASDTYRIKEVKRGTTPYVIEATVPAWDAASKHNLLGDNGLGYEELVDAFNEGAKHPLVAEAKQVAVAKFDKDGFEAAALTALVMARSAMPRFMTQHVFELNFTKPFVFISYSDNLPMFSGYICKAKEGE